MQQTYSQCSAMICYIAFILSFSLFLCFARSAHSSTATTTLSAMILQLDRNLSTLSTCLTGWQRTRLLTQASSNRKQDDTHHFAVDVQA